MKSNRLIIFPLLFIFLHGIAQTSSNGARKEILLNADWKFKAGDSTEAKFYKFLDDSKWQTVQVPHDASIYGAFTKESDRSNGWRPRAKGIYRKSFKIAATDAGKKVFIEFEGVYREAEVWINGQYLGKKLNGYIGFEYDLTSFVDFDKENVIAVFYDNTTAGTSRWYTGEGIYRNVKLKILDNLHIPLYGTYITTPQITDKAAIVKIETKVKNETITQTECCLVTEIIAPNGTKIASSKAVLPISPSKERVFNQTISVSSPVLWNVLDAHMYTAVSKVYQGNNLVDEYSTRFGIREITISPEKGLLVNGKKIIAKGGNLHHDLGCLGSAAIKAGYEKHIDELIAIGCNSVRLSHNPHAPSLLDVCDERGVLVFDEAFDKWNSQYYGGKKSFEDMWRTDVESFIKRDRNHPSVYIWSMGNEVLNQLGKHDEKYEKREETAADYGAGILRKMTDFTHLLEPTRPVTAALYPAREKTIKEKEHWNDYETFLKSKPAEMAFESDVVSWNYTENMFAIDHKNYPQFMFIASETGTNLETGTRKISWLEIDTTYVIGHYYWSAYDYLGESPWPRKTWGRSLIDLSGWVTPIGRMYQSFYSYKPMVHIMVFEQDKNIVADFNKPQNKLWDWYPMVDHWNWKNYTKVKITTFTNCEEVELFLNDTSLGKQKLANCDQKQMNWEIPFTPGILKAVAMSKGKIVAEHILRTAGKEESIKLKVDKTEISADGAGLAYIDVSIVDKSGVLVPLSGKEIEFEVSGAGYNAGVTNGDIISDELWQANKRSTWHGHCRLIIRSTNKAGQIKIKASAAGIKTAEISIRGV